MKKYIINNDYELVEAAECDEDGMGMEQLLLSVKNLIDWQDEDIVKKAAEMIKLSEEIQTIASEREKLLNLFLKIPHLKYE